MDPSMMLLTNPSDNFSHGYDVIQIGRNQNEGAIWSEGEDAGNQSAESFDTVGKYVVCVLLSFVIFMSITGNLLVCLAIYTDRRLRKLGNMFLASLALADLLLACLVMTFAVVNDMMGYWMFGPQFCDIWIAFDVMCCTASILNLCAISLDRFIHIKDPLRYNRWVTKKIIMASVATVWSLSALISFLPISLGWHKPPPSSAQTVVHPANRPTCALDLTPTYAIVSSSISFYVPCVIMVALYTRLYLYARKHVRNIKSVTKPLRASGSTSSNDSRSHRNHRALSTVSHHIMDHKAAITLGFIMGVFLVCWVPFFFINIVAAFCKTCIPLVVFKVLTWLGYCNSALNPVIYSIFNTEFRDAFRKILVSYVREECCWKYCGKNSDRRGCYRGGTRRKSNKPQSPGAPDTLDKIEIHCANAGKISEI